MAFFILTPSFPPVFFLSIRVHCHFVIYFHFHIIFVVLFPFSSIATHSRREFVNPVSLLCGLEGLLTLIYLHAVTSSKRLADIDQLAQTINCWEPTKD